MQFNDDNSGVPTFLIGLIVLVMAGVGLSIIVDKRFRFSSGYSTAQTEIRANNEMLGDLKYQHETRSMLLADSSARRQVHLSELGKLPREVEALKEKKIALVNRKNILTDSVVRLEDESLRYRAEYRQKSWARAIGENLGNLKLKSGREYLNVKITRVTEAGLEISHENGFARISASDLDPKLRDRFQIELVRTRNPQSGPLERQ
jgi:hypothetical protein